MICLASFAHVNLAAQLGAGELLVHPNHLYPHWINTRYKLDAAGGDTVLTSLDELILNKNSLGLHFFLSVAWTKRLN